MTNRTRKKVGHKPNHDKREEWENKDKELGTKHISEGMYNRGMILLGTKVV